MYDTPKDALDSLSAEEKDEQFIRLVLVATTRQLTPMLSTGKELCRPRAALYLRVASTCPLYYLSWDEFGVDPPLSIVSRVPRRATRQAMLDAVKGSADGSEHAVTASVSNKHRSNSSRTAAKRPLSVHPGDYVVGSRGFDKLTSSRNCSSKRKQQKEQEEGSVCSGEGSSGDSGDSEESGDEQGECD